MLCSMAIDTTTLQSAAEQLCDADHKRTQVRPLSAVFPGLTVEDAYAIQHATLDIKLRQGRALAGWKVGLTSKKVQEQFRATEPAYGALLADTRVANRGELESSRFKQVKIEPELAFVLARGLSGPSCSVEDVLAATSHVVAAIEIVASRVQESDPVTKAPRTIADLIADNTSAAGYVLGDVTVSPSEIDIRAVEARCLFNGTPVESGISSAVLGNPAAAVAWLANNLHPRDHALHPGQVILTGSFTRPLPMKQGDLIEADFGPLATVAFKLI